MHLTSSGPAFLARGPILNTRRAPMSLTCGSRFLSNLIASDTSSAAALAAAVGLDTLEELVGRMLEDEAVRTAWEHAIEDPEFAGDWRARYLWWYRQTPYWDEQVGLLPVYRVMNEPLPVTDR